MKKQKEKEVKIKIIKALKVLGLVLVVLFLWAGYKTLILGKQSGRKFNGSIGRYKEQASLARGGIGAVKDEADFELEAMEKRTVTSDALMEGEPMLGNGNYIPTQSTEKKVIKNGFLTLKVKDTDGAAKEISEIVGANGGEVFSSNFNEYVRGSKSGSITVKVPVDKFQQVLEELKKVATQVISESTSGQDVTERYVDLKAQLKNKRAEEETFVGLLDRSGKLDDVLKVSREIARVRGEIERLEGKIKYLESQTSMSTITINLSEDVAVTPVGDDWRPVQVAKKALNDLKKQSQDFVDNIIRFVIVIIPAFIPFVLFLVFIFWLGRKLIGVIWKK